MISTTIAIVSVAFFAATSAFLERFDASSERSCLRAVKTVVHLSLATAIMRVGWTLAAPEARNSIMFAVVLDAFAITLVTISAYLIAHKKKRAADSRSTASCSVNGQDNPFELLGDFPPTADELRLYSQVYPPLRVVRDPAQMPESIHDRLDARVGVVAIVAPDAEQNDLDDDAPLRVPGLRRVSSEESHEA